MTPENKPTSSDRFTQTIARLGTSKTDRPQSHRIQEIRNLTDTAFILRFDKNTFRFTAGQHMTLQLPGNNQMREYSIYSAPDAPYLEVLIQEVEKGYLSKKLHRVKPGDQVLIDGPFGFFSLDEDYATKKYLFVATGTGIAPFHSIALGHPGLDYKIVHGIRYGAEAYERNAYPANRYVACASRDHEGDFQGRVTDYLSRNEIDSNTFVYLCGNCDMIYEVYDLLTSRGIDADKIRTEVYF